MKYEFEMMPANPKHDYKNKDISIRSRDNHHWKSNGKVNYLQKKVESEPLESK